MELDLDREDSRPPEANASVQFESQLLPFHFDVLLPRQSSIRMQSQTWLQSWLQSEQSV